MHRILYWANSHTSFGGNLLSFKSSARAFLQQVVQMHMLSWGCKESGFGVSDGGGARFYHQHRSASQSSQDCKSDDWEIMNHIDLEEKKREPHLEMELIRRRGSWSRGFLDLLCLCWHYRGWHMHTKNSFNLLVLEALSYREIAWWG